MGDEADNPRPEEEVADEVAEAEEEVSSTEASDPLDQEPDYEPHDDDLKGLKGG